MAKRIIRTGTTADPTGDSLKNAFTKVNDNFTELYNALGLDAETLNLGAFEFTGSVMTTTDSSAIVIDQATTVTSNLSVGGDLLPQTANGGDLGSSSLPWRSLYVSNNTIYLGGTALAVNQSGQLTVGGVAANTSDQLVNATDKIVLNEEGATRLSMYLNNVEKTRIQINGNDLLLSSLAGGVVLAATDGVGGEWRFKTNGNLESTGGNFLSAAETPAVFGSLNSTSTGASSGTVTLKSGTGNVDGGSIYIEAGTGGSGNDGEVAIRTGSTPYEWLFDNGGNLTLPRGSLKHDDALGFFTVEGPVTADMIDAGTPGVYQTISNGVEIVTHQPGPDTERKFRFAWDGALYMPTDTSNGQVGALEWRINNGNTTSQVRSTPGGGIFPPGLALVSYGENPGISFNVNFNKNWIFDQYGNTRIPGDIVSEGNINIDINLTDSTLRRWSFGEDGALTFPDGTSQTTAYTGGGGTGTLTLLNNQIYPSIDNGGSVGTSSRRFNEGWFVNAVYVGNFGAEALSQIDGGRIFLTNTVSQDPVKLFLNNVEFGNNSTGLRQGLLITENIDGTIYTYLRANNVSKKVDFPNGLTGHLAGTTENIESENDVSIRVNLSDSTTRIWQFGEDGVLNVPGAIQLANGAQIFNTAGVDDSITIGATGTPGTTTFNGSGFFNGDTFFHRSIQEKFSSLQDATGVVTHNCENGHIFYHTSPDANWTVNLTNFSLITNYATAITIIISQGGTGYYPNALQIGGAAQTINWQGNATPTPSTNRVDVVTFSIFLTGGGYNVLGQLTGF